MQILREDIEFIHKQIQICKSRFRGKKILITGCSGFLGFELALFFLCKMEALGIAKITLYDTKYPRNLLAAAKLLGVDLASSEIEFKSASGSCLGDFGEHFPFNFIFHLASIASPSVYRKFPLETIHTNTTMLRELLDLARLNMGTELDGFLVMSSSEIYGDPHQDWIPTPEAYNGNVSCVGPRACYDESKRLAETLSWIYRHHYDMNIRVARPFNNFGPGLATSDGRLPADLASAVLEKKDIALYSDGTPTRTFCYISDAVILYLRHIASVSPNYTLNIGNQQNEISVSLLAESYRDIGSDMFGYGGSISYKPSDDKDYLAYNPNRRCPDVSLATATLGYTARVPVQEGIRRYLSYLHSDSSD